jgi:betaine-aldehyde dehydrogenase
VTAVQDAPSDAQVEAFVRRPWHQLIGGELVPAARGATMDVVDPARDEVVATAPQGGPADVDLAVSAALGALPAWRAASSAARAAVLRTAADRLEAHGEELAWIDTIDNGTPIRVMRSDYRLAVDHLRAVAGLALQVRGETLPVDERDAVDLTLRDPFGVVGRIVPFNHPLMFAAARIAAPLLAGNTVVLKPSEQTSLSALRMAELVADLVPAGVLNVVTGPGASVGERLVEHPDVPRIAFTGGVDVGRRIQQVAARSRVKTVTLELGGKNPLIVFPDADLDAAVDGAIRGMNFSWQGQSCGSTSRVYAHRSVYQQVVDGLAARMSVLVVGDPRDEATDVGALVSRRHYDAVTGYITGALATPGVRLLTGGPSGPGPGYVVPPTLFAVDQGVDADVVTQEIFGPVLVVLPFDDYDGVLHEANKLPFGLTASVWTRDLRTAMAASRDLEAGYVWVNSSSAHIPGASFGGVKDSGVGREEGLDEVLSFTQPKNVYIRF